MDDNSREPSNPHPVMQELHPDCPAHLAPRVTSSGGETYAKSASGGEGYSSKKDTSDCVQRSSCLGGVASGGALYDALLVLSRYEDVANEYADVGPTLGISGV